MNHCGRRHLAHRIDIAVTGEQGPAMFRRFWWVFLVTAGMGPVVGIVLAAVVTYTMPKFFESEGIIELKQQGTSALSQQYFATEIEKIKSRSILEQVADNLMLINRWAVNKETAVRMLRDSLSTRNIYGTNLISIRARHTNKVDARDIAAEISQTYRKYREHAGEEEFARALPELNKAMEEQKSKVQEREAALDSLTKNTRAHPELLQHDEAADTPEEAATRAKDRQDIADAKRDIITEKELLEKMITMKIVAAAPPDPPFASYTEPVISYSPVSPNVTLNLILGSALGFLLSPLLALPITVLLNRMKA